jgi:hypothetical protein
MAFRLYNPAPVYMDLAGTAPAAAGTLETYSDEACTTPLATYNSPDLDVANPVEIDLDADGRASVEIWSGVPFFLRLKESDGTVVWTREITSGVPAGLTLPTLNEGEFLTGDGTDYLAQTITLLPDPSGSAGYAVVANADGDGYTLQAFPEAPEAPTLDITVGQAEFIVGDGTSTTKQVVLTGSATGVNAGGRTQTVSVTFSTAFAATPNVQVTLATTSSLASGQNQPSPRVSSKSTTGFTVEWMMGETDDDRTQFDFNAAVTFDWMAFGTRVIA